MGMFLIRDVLTMEHIKLSHAEKVVLLTMAFTAKDQKTLNYTPRYWAGYEPLAKALQMPNPKGDTPEAKKSFRAIAKHIQSLLKKGAIKLVEKPRPGRQAVYDLSPIGELPANEW